MKRFISVLLVSCMLPFGALASNALPFDDVSADDRYAEAIFYLFENGIVGGYPDGTFKPYNEINRAEFTKILVEGAGYTPSVDMFNNCFSDVGDEWFAGYVCYAKQIGWVDGHPDGSFKPEQTVNKVESIKMIFNGLGIGPIPPAVAEPPFDDVPVDAWYAGYVAKAQEMKVLDDWGIFLNPGEKMTRAAVSLLMYNTKMYQVEREDSAFFYRDLDLNELVVKQEAEVTRVIDGDTIEVLIDGVKESVRLLGLDAPELSSDDCFAEEARDYLDELIFWGQNPMVVLRNDPMNDDKDKYGRLLRYVQIEEGDAGLQLISDGFALYYDRFPVTFADEYVAAELEAQTNVAGLWLACQSAE